MDLFAELFQISKLLLAEEDAERTPELLLRRMQAPGLATQRVELPTSLELAESVATIA